MEEREERVIIQADETVEYLFEALTANGVVATREDLYMVVNLTMDYLVQKQVLKNID